ncbi:MAG: MBL fold metallo-hydrolase [Bacteroidetes bacterium]|nr:MBL fold metallo-hydrolase [Bacteroidota bacterium]
MQLTFLGTGTSQGVPVIGCPCTICQSPNPHDARLRSSVLLEWDEFKFVIDTGPDFRQQMLRESVKTLNGVVFTHEHKDHIAGLDDIRAFNFLTQKPMAIYCNLAVEDALKREFSYAFYNKNYPGVPQMELHSIDNQPFELGNKTWIPLPVMHAKMPVLGFRIGSLSYITDANFIGEETQEKIKGSEILILNALRHEEHVSHFTLEQAMKLAHKLEIPQVYFTHISHQLGLHDDISRQLPSHMHLAHDGLKLQFT